MLLLTAPLPTVHRTSCTRLITRALAKAEMTHKEAALNAQVSFPEWSRAVHGLRSFDLAWVLAQPWAFQMALCEEILNAAWRQHVAAKADDAAFWLKKEA